MIPPTWGLALLLTPSVQAESTPDWSVGVSVDRVAWLASVAWFGSRAQGVLVRRSLPHHLHAGFEGRLLQSTLVTSGDRFELGGSFGYTPDHHWYRPTVALSGGWSGGIRFDWAAYHGPGWEEQAPGDRADYRPWYAGIQVEPLTVRVRALELSVLAVDLGQMGWGRVVRARVQLARLGACW